MSFLQLILKGQSFLTLRGGGCSEPVLALGIMDGDWRSGER